jgi:hypothetical protein
MGILVLDRFARCRMWNLVMGTDGNLVSRTGDNASLTGRVRQGTTTTLRRDRRRAMWHRLLYAYAGMCSQSPAAAVLLCMGLHCIGY